MPGEMSLAALWREAEPLMKSGSLDRAESVARQLVLRYLTAREVVGAPPARVDLANTFIARLGREP